jgi:Acetyltransferase (GNAT) domain
MECGRTHSGFLPWLGGLRRPSRCMAAARRLIITMRAMPSKTPRPMLERPQPSALASLAILVGSCIVGADALAADVVQGLGSICAAFAPGCMIGSFADLKASILLRKEVEPCREKVGLAEPAIDAPAKKGSRSDFASDGTTSYAHSLFEQPWWLDALVPGAWDAVTVVKDGEIVGRLPFVRKRYLGLSILTQPTLTPFLGPWLNAGGGKAHTRLANEHQLLAELIAALPPHDVFIQNFHRSMTNCLAFYWHGFALSNYYTYVLDQLSDREKIWAGFRENIRREIRKAERQLSVRPLEDIDTFIRLRMMTYERQGISMPESADLIGRLDAACSARGVRRMLLAEGADGSPHAAIYLVWDAESVFYLMGGSDPGLRHSGATSLLMWEAIKFAGHVAKRFDFEGSMLQPVERFFRAFGGQQRQAPRLTRGCTLKGQLALIAYDLRAARKRCAANG